MNLSLGVNSIGIDRRYSFDWLFDLMAEAGVRYLQLASFFEMYFISDDWLLKLADKAKQRNIRIKSLFTSARELGGAMTGDPEMARVARRNYLRLLDVAAVLGVDSAGSNMGACHRDNMAVKDEGIRRGVELLKEMSFVAHGKGLKAITVEPMSCLAEPPTLPDECEALTRELAAHHEANAGTVPVYFCADISHGYADAGGGVVVDNWSLFEMQIPRIFEFHFKNTDAIFNSTFGFDAGERERGIVKLDRFKAMIERNAAKFPNQDLTGYLELTGPKCGRDYSDVKYGGMLRESLAALRDAFGF